MNLYQAVMELAVIGHGTASGTGVLSLPSIPGTAKAALVRVEDQALRWRADGTDPTATTGMLEPVGADMLFGVAQLRDVRFISTSSTSATTIWVTYYG